MNIGFIGAGNMAAAIAKGLSLKKSHKIFLYDVDMQKAEALCIETSGFLYRTAGEIVENSDYVILAIKPNVYKAVLSELAEKVRKHKPVLISIAAGTTLQMVEQMIDSDSVPVIRVMPNVNAMVSEAISAVCKNEAATKEQLEGVLEIFGAVGKSVEIEESLFPAYTAIGGCSPAFAFLFIDSLANAALKHGIPKEKAVKIAAQALLGSAKTLLESGENPWALIEKVCSPGGTTIEGVLALQEEGIAKAVTAAVDATMVKDKKISER